MSLEDPYSLAGLDVPASDRVIGRSGQKNPPFQVNGHTRQRSGVFLQCVNDLARFEGPHDGRLISRPRYKQVLCDAKRPAGTCFRRHSVAILCRVFFVVGYKDHWVDASLVTGEDSNDFTRVEIPTANGAIV